MNVLAPSLVAFVAASCATPQGAPGRTESTGAPSAPAPAAPAQTATASAAAPQATPPAPGTASAAPVEPAMPDVDVKNIGMHVGGGKNDAAEKAPIHKSVDPHLDAFRKCFAQAEDTTKGGDVSIDLKIDKAGGKAVIQKSRSGVKGKAFEACVREAFEAIDFQKPTGGTTVVSYSLRFTPRTPKGGGK